MIMAIKNPESAKVVLYQSADGKVAVDVRFERENFWLTQKALAELFGVRVPAVNKHLKNILASGELAEDSVISILETTATDGKTYATQFYNLESSSQWHRRTLEPAQTAARFIGEAWIQRNHSA
jgi:hypothetical protein